MLLKDKYPELEEHYNIEYNETPFHQKEYNSTEKLYWNTCAKKHTNHQTALEFKRHSICLSCTNILQNNINIEETLKYRYPTIAQLLSPINNKLYADALRPDSKQKSKWLDTVQKTTIKERVDEYDKKNNKQPNYIPWKKLLKLKKENINPYNEKNSTKILNHKTNTLFIEEYPELAQQCLNDLSIITTGSNKVFEWKCTKGHIYNSSIKNIIKRKNKCLVCAGLSLLEGYNDLTTTHPKLSQKIIEPNPKTITSSYNGTIKFKCNTCNHIWESKRIRYDDNSIFCPVCLNRTVLQGYNDLETLMPQIVNSWSSKNKHKPSELTKGSEEAVYLICSKDNKHLLKTAPYILARNPERNNFICSHCNISNGEYELQEFIKSLNIPYSFNNRTILNGKELDIYLPDNKIAIEFNGVYWHSEKFKDKNYHYDKYEQCMSKNIQLITIYEDDWNNKKEIIKKTLLHKLKILSNDTFYARKTTCKKIHYNEANDFLNNYHVQGGLKANHHYGLYNNLNNLVAVLSYTINSKNELYVNRYATLCNVPGGFTKLLKNIISKNPTVRKVITFSDNSISDGSLYKNNGFIKDKELKPDYYYVYRGERYHKFNFRKSRFKNDPELIYNDSMTELQLATMNNIYRIWDAGKIRWVKEL